MDEQQLLVLRLIGFADQLGSTSHADYAETVRETAHQWEALPSRLFKERAPLYAYVLDMLVAQYAVIQ